MYIHPSRRRRVYWNLYAIDGRCIRHIITEKELRYRQIAKRPGARRQGRKARKHMGERNGAAWICSGTSSPILSQRFCCMLRSKGRWAFCDFRDGEGGRGVEKERGDLGEIGSIIILDLI